MTILKLSESGRRRLLGKLLVALLALTVAAFGFALLLKLAGVPAMPTLLAILKGAFGSLSGLRDSLGRATPLLLCALAVAVPARAGLFNIGAEGQLHIGAIAATAVALHTGAAPPLTVLPLMLFGACLAGAAWGAIPALLKGFLNVSEVLVALMLNYVAILLVEYLVHGPWKDPSALGWPYSASFPESAIVPQWHSLHLCLGFGIVAALLLAFLAARTTFGFSLQVLAANPTVASVIGIRRRTWLLVTMLVGAALAAIAGLGEVSAIQGRLRPDLSPGYGYLGFLISWLSGHRFIRIIVVSFLFGGLYVGGDALQLTAALPSAAFDIMFGLFFVAVLLVAPLQRPAACRVEVEK